MLLLIFLEKAIFTTLFRGLPTFWNSTLKMTTLFRRCLALFISTLKSILLFLWLLVFYYLTNVFVFVLFTLSASHPHLCWDNRSQMFLKIGVLKNFANFTRKHLDWSIFLIKLQAWNPGTLLKEDFDTSKCFPVKFAKFLRALFLKNICEWLFQHRRCGCDVDDVKRTRTNTSVK